MGFTTDMTVLITLEREFTKDWIPNRLSNKEPESARMVVALGELAVKSWNS